MRTRQQNSQARSGLSVVEVLVALMLVTVGLLAMAGSTALALRTSSDALRRRQASQRIASRMAQLSATGCALARAGAIVDPQLNGIERWTVAPTANGFAEVTDSVDWLTPNGRRTLAIVSAIPC